jgi:hypothetical protein
VGPGAAAVTLLFDPGRIKRGLKPREELGPALLDGGSYTLQIDSQWRDGRGQPLKETWSKSFRVAPPDDRQPDTADWKITAPAAATREALRVQFDEPLDHGLSRSMISIEDSAGGQVPGEIEVANQETEWLFTPSEPWRAGTYELVVDTRIEDLAGNSIARTFEVDLFDTVQREVPERRVRIPWQCAAGIAGSGENEERIAPSPEGR